MGINANERKRFQTASRAYAEDIGRTQPHTVRPDGTSGHTNAFYMDSEGKTHFDPWTDSENKSNGGVGDYYVDENGQKMAAWKAMPEYYQENAIEQTDYITAALERIQEQGNAYLERLYKRQSNTMSENA